MIIHPDGRIEGTPEELAAYQRAVQVAPVIVEQQVPVIITKPITAPEWPPFMPKVWCGGITYGGPGYFVQN